MEADARERVWKALGDGTRRRLLDLLREGPRTTGGLCTAFPQLSRYAVMKHLAVLESAGLVLARRRGRERLNHLNPVPLQQVIDRWVGRYAALWSRTLVDLKHTVESGAAPAGPTGEVSMEGVGQFEIEQEVRVAAPMERVFRALSEEVGEWWAFRTLGEQARMHMEPTAGGRFWEEAPDGRCALWGTVLHLEPPRELRLAGPLGLSGMVLNHYGYTLEADGEETIVRLRHRALGEVDEAAGENYRNGWATLLHEKLKAHVEGTA